MPPQPPQPCSLIDRFSLKQKLLMRTGWLGLMAVGTGGIYLQDHFWALVYIISALAGFALVVLPGLCAHCPYPSTSSTCLFLPAQFVLRFYPYRGPRMSLGGKLAVAAVIIGLIALPQFWLIQRPGLLALFWLLALPAIAAFPLHYCRRCRHMGCPLNQAAGQLVEDRMSS